MALWAYFFIKCADLKFIHRQGTFEYHTSVNQNVRSAASALHTQQHFRHDPRPATYQSCLSSALF